MSSNAALPQWMRRAPWPTSGLNRWMATTSAIESIWDISGTSNGQHAVDLVVALEDLRHRCGRSRPDLRACVQRRWAQN
eukprot:1550756-Prymnesium_polylepis.1